MITPPGADDRPTAHIGPVPAAVRPDIARGGPHQGPKLLADEFHLLAHDDRTGKPRLHGAATNYGIAAALLGELAAAGRITFDRGRLWVRDTRPPDDWLQHLVLARLVAEPQHTATRTWLAFLAETVPEQVAERLWQAGKVEPQQHRRLLRTPTTVYVPTNTNVAAWSWARLSTLLRDHKRLNPFDLVLMGIVNSCGLGGFVLDGARPSVYANLRRQLAEGPQPMRELLADLDTAVGSAVLSHRT
ncbi:GOLPH3/VPS74 family protein [Micromonospora eburnea]|uniref:GOLPH3/VPS74 family protein n=1 Tax=Micromonospora eburnea TaxID=227316 RepID=UPI001428B4D5|nr:GPP34 family phosphoprotein [Micromonospora eburnea]